MPKPLGDGRGGAEWRPPVVSVGKQKQSLYFPADMLAEISAAAVRLDRSMSWIIQRAWKTARGRIMNAPASDDSTQTDGADSDGGPSDGDR
jgi:uncharacterized small protein (TIGR04563 family)